MRSRSPCPNSHRIKWIQVYCWDLGIGNWKMEIEEEEEEDGIKRKIWEFYMFLLAWHIHTREFAKPIQNRHTTVPNIKKKKTDLMD